MKVYLEKLHAMLGSLNTADRDESMDYYREYLEDGHFTKYNDCVKELGTPRALSKKILADYSINNSNQHHISNIKTTWLIILAILVSPVALLVSLPVLGVIFALIVAGAAILFALTVTMLAMGVTVILTLPITIGKLFSNFSSGMTLLGADLLMTGVVLIIIPLIVWFTKLITKCIKQVSTWLYYKVMNHKYQPKGANQQ